MHETEFALVASEMQPPIFFPSAKKVTLPDSVVVAVMVFAVLKVAVLSPEFIARVRLGVLAAAIEKLLIGLKDFASNLTSPCVVVGYKVLM